MPPKSSLAHARRFSTELCVGGRHAAGIFDRAVAAVFLARHEALVQRARRGVDRAAGWKLGAGNRLRCHRPQPAPLFAQRNLQKHRVAVEDAALDVGGLERLRLHDGGVTRTASANLGLQLLVVAREVIELPSRRFRLLVRVLPGQQSGELR